MKTLISILGPTAVGKTALGVQLAKQLQTQIISADSRQVFKQMDIGTAKVTGEEAQGVPHHMIDWLEPDAPFSAGIFAREAHRLLTELFEKQEVVLLVGGSGLYLRAVWEGFDEIPEVSPETRAALGAELEEKGLSALVGELEKVDPETWAVIDRNNHRRVQRALEVYRETGKPISAFRTGGSKPPPCNLLKIGLEAPREILYERINQRVDLMLEAGLEEEVRRLYEKYGADSVLGQTVGYQEWFPFFEGKYSRTEAIHLVKRNSRRFAKRQFTWFKRYEDIHWFDFTQLAEIPEWVNQQLSAKT